MTQFSDVVVKLQHELDMLKADYADCNRERIRWKTIADNQLNALTGAQELIDLLAANCSDRVTIESDPRWGIVCNVIDKAIA